MIAVGFAVALPTLQLKRRVGRSETAPFFYSRSVGWVGVKRKPTILQLIMIAVGFAVALPTLQPYSP
jgi:hypothetical protein